MADDPHPRIIVHHVLLAPSYPALHAAKALPIKTKATEPESCTQIHPPHPSPWTHVTMKDYLRIRNEGRSLPTYECFCSSCEEYEEFIKAVKLSLPDDMAQKKGIRRINAIAQEIMVKILGGEEVDVEIGCDAEIKEMIIGVLECRICRSG